jgi:hypothetical protein
MQQNRANPLLSRVGCATTIVMVMVLGIILRYFGGGPFSPGRLSAASPRQEPLAGFTSHADFEAECSRCHAPWIGSAADRCVACHTDVAEQRSARSGMHGRFPESEDCSRCHTEHKGPEAAITTYDLGGFEHDLLTDFSLARHKANFDGGPILCSDCHLGPQYQASQIDCRTCHVAADPVFMADHASFYGESCLACHDGRDSMVPFNHQTVFPLEGQHIGLECRRCHAPTVLAGAPTDCADCHAEPAVHAGQFGLDCARCHTPVAWQPARLRIHTFPLDHGGIKPDDCQSCHLQRYDVYSCTDCHAHEPEEIRALHVEAGILEFSACADCHPTGLESEIDEESG